MKLNKDCIRDILMYVEQNNVYEEIKNFKYSSLHTISFDDLCEDETIKSKYKHDVIYYTIEKMKDYGLIITSKESHSSIKFEGFKNHHINGITPRGHEFLDNAKNDIIWNNTQNTIKTAGLEDCSFEVLFKIIYSEVDKQVSK